MKEPHLPEIEQTRKPEHPIHPLILNRWSPRAMTGEPIPESEIHSLFEAARWAPSSYNNQPWRFLYVKRDTPDWHTLFDLLVDFNKEWCSKAALLGLIFSRLTFERNNKPCVTHALDTGAAWENICLEGTSRGLAVHGMQGFNFEKAKLLIPEGHEVLAMFAAGKRAPKSTLSFALQEKELPSQRKKVSEFVYLGQVPK